MIMLIMNIANYNQQDSPDLAILENVCVFFGIKK